MMVKGECVGCDAPRMVGDDHGLCSECVGASLAAAEWREHYGTQDTLRSWAEWDDYDSARREMETYL